LAATRQRIELEISSNHGRRQGGKTGVCLPTGNCDKKTNIFRKSEINNLIPIDSLNSCNDGLFARMALTLHKSQDHCSGVQKLCVLSRLPKLAIGLFCCWALLRSNYMPRNLLRFTSSYSNSRRFASSDFWTQTSWQVIKRES